MVRLVAVVIVAGVAAGGCVASADGKAVRAATAEFSAAVEHGDGERACADLVPKAAQSLASGGSSCADEIRKLGLHGGDIANVQVWGDYAQAAVGTGTVFLTRWGSGWKVSAAGCTRRTDRPYECEVEA
jgi:hypothetical protein